MIQIIFLLHTLLQAAPSDALEAEFKAQAASRLFVEFVEGPDEHSIPVVVLKRSKCIAIFPDIYKDAFMVGGSGGWGLASCRKENNSWSYPTYLNIAGVSGAIKLGVEKLDLVLIFFNLDAPKILSQEYFRLDSSLRIALGPIGRYAGFDDAPEGEVYSYSRAKGCFTQTNPQGSVVQSRDKYNKLVYSETGPYEILTSLIKRQGKKLGTVELLVSTLENHAPR